MSNHVIHVAIFVIHVIIHVHLGQQMCQRSHFQLRWGGWGGGVKKCFQGLRPTAKRKAVMESINSAGVRSRPSQDPLGSRGHC
jgi:hypothetical protein